MKKVKEFVNKIINAIKSAKVTVTFKTPLIDLSLTPATIQAAV